MDAITFASLVQLDITMETFGGEHKEAIINALIKTGYYPRVLSLKLFISKRLKQ